MSMSVSEQVAPTLPAPSLGMLLKQCACGAVHTHTEWIRLPFVGHQPDYVGGLLELRNCGCGSTIAVQVVR